MNSIWSEYASLTFFKLEILECLEFVILICNKSLLDLFNGKEIIELTVDFGDYFIINLVFYSKRY